MRQSGPQRRGRGRPSGRRGFNNSPNRSYDSSGPEVKIRGTASTVFEKYQTLARDAVLSGDRVAAENYFQHAEHYYRVMQATKQQQAGEGDQRPDQRNDQRDNRSRNHQAGQQSSQQGGRQNSDGRGDDAAAGANANIAAVEDEPTAVNADAPPQADEVATDTSTITTTNTTAANADIPVVITADAVADTPDNQSADTAGAVDRDERYRPMNPAELAAMSGDGRKPRRSSKANGANDSRSDVSADSDAKPDANLDASSDDNADVSEPVSQPAPRRAPRRRRPAPAQEAATTDVEDTAAPVIEDVEPS